MYPRRAAALSLLLYVFTRSGCNLVNKMSDTHYTEMLLESLDGTNKTTNKVYLSKALFGLKQSLETLTPQDIEDAYKLVKSVLKMRYKQPRSSAEDKLIGAKYISVLRKAKNILEKHLDEIKAIFLDPRFDVVAQGGRRHRRRSTMH